ncbi:MULTISPECIES: hypothetical protein [unclassified Amycolatopsis]|uniref:hypothetical protein n=1 Tax=unclassified Amycolatopsis TaxID=2618356 RepID=UPI002874FD00|nr:MULTISPECIES: hypothetical protein [unclassified Amycolatopsis]MDS0135895.1 hypothetical protein [Amycolatopsis sp. 505]MDS0145516.1 hypothetical protein [Amycolatopsis sp. CM201R]
MRAKKTSSRSGVCTDSVNADSSRVPSPSARAPAAGRARRRLANEVVRGALALETHLTKAEQELLNPIGVNCVRSFSGKGM